MKNRKILFTLLLTALVTTQFSGCMPTKTEVKQPATDQSATNKSVTDKSATNKSVTDKSATNNSASVYKNPTVSSADDAIKLLKDGNTRFVNNKLANYDLSQARRTELTTGQKPFAVVVTCSDSRVSPEHLFDQGLGDIFVIRVAGNILDEAEIGSIEYAVEHLKSPLVVILGHESCGAVTTAVSKVEKPTETHTTENIDAFLDNIEPAVTKAKESKLEGKELIEKSADINVAMAVDQLIKESDIVKESVDTGKVKVVGTKYLLSNGTVEWFK